MVSYAARAVSRWQRLLGRAGDDARRQNGRTEGLVAAQGGAGGGDRAATLGRCRGLPALSGGPGPVRVIARAVRARNSADRVRGCGRGPAAGRGGRIAPALAAGPSG